MLGWFETALLFAPGLFPGNVETALSKTRLCVKWKKVSNQLFELRGIAVGVRFVCCHNSQLSCNKDSWDALVLFRRIYTSLSLLLLFLDD